MLWCTTERRVDADAALAGDETAVAAMVRGHLEITGITTVAALAASTGLAPTRVEVGLTHLEQRGAAMQGRYSPAARTHEDAPVEWVSRRLLARMHAGSRRSRRSSVDPVTAQDFMRFLLRWQHLAPGTQLVGEAGLHTLVEQLQGWEAAAVAWEADLLAGRMRRYEPAWLDRLSHAGDVAWLRVTPSDRAVDAPAVAPSKATPISLVCREDLPWLLAAARAGGPPAEPAVGATAEILDVLRERGACFASELAAATHRLPDDIERALWDGVARGLVMSDGFGAIRARVARSASSTDARRFSRLARGARASATAAAGRWSLVPAGAGIDPGSDGAPDREDLAEAVAELLLRRWGVVCRDVAVHDSLRFPWRDLQWALRRLEDRGLVRGGRFVSRAPRRAVRAARGRGAARTGAPPPAHRRAGQRERGRPAQPRRARRPRRHGAVGAHAHRPLRRRHRDRPRRRRRVQPAGLTGLSRPWAVAPRAPGTARRAPRMRRRCPASCAPMRRGRACSSR